MTAITNCYISECFDSVAISHIRHPDLCKHMLQVTNIDRSNFNHDILAVKIVGNWFLKLGIVNQFSSACSLICQIILGELLMPRELA